MLGRVVVGGEESVASGVIEGVRVKGGVPVPCPPLKKEWDGSKLRVCDSLAWFEEVGETVCGDGEAVLARESEVVLTCDAVLKRDGVGWPSVVELCPEEVMPNALRDQVCEELLLALSTCEVVWRPSEVVAEAVLVRLKVGNVVESDSCGAEGDRWPVGVSSKVRDWVSDLLALFEEVSEMVWGELDRVIEGSELAEGVLVVPITVWLFEVVIEKDALVNNDWEVNEDTVAEPLLERVSMILLEVVAVQQSTTLMVELPWLISFPH